MSKSGSVLGGILLVAGTSIGGGMLALPVLTSLGGFVPSLVIYLSCWLFMASTGLLFLEVAQWMEKESNIVTMARETLGRPGAWAAWAIYLFLFYCLTLAYIVGCGNLVVELFGGSIPDWLGPLLFILLFAPIVYAGTRVVGRCNAFLMIGLGLSFLLFVALGWQTVKPELLAYRNWKLSLIGLPIAFTSFAYQGIIPTLVTYFHHDIGKARKAILIGSFIPFITYVIWQWLILGNVPTYGPGGLAEALEKGQNAVYPLKYFIQDSRVYIIAQYFAFFALVTSFFGVTLGLVDFLADGLKIKKDAAGKGLLCLMVFIPPLCLALIYPHIFLVALDFAGGFGCALLLGLLPVLMVWSGRYIQQRSSTYALPGGRLTLVALTLFILFELVCEITK
jgi:tyrosine-specific transport protein